VALTRKQWARLKVFGVNLRRERVRKGWTQEKLAERANIATRNLQKIEGCENNVLLTTAFRLQLALRCPWKRLMPKEGSFASGRCAAKRIHFLLEVFQTMISPLLFIGRRSVGEQVASEPASQQHGSCLHPKQE
jgi:transcriptional regulator with XRE-family HTH domain